MFSSWRYLRTYAPTCSVVDYTDVYVQRFGNAHRLLLIAVLCYQASDRLTDTYTMIDFSATRLEIATRKSREGDSLYVLEPCDLSDPVCWLAPKASFTMAYTFVRSIGVGLQPRLPEKTTISIKSPYSIRTYTRNFKLKKYSVRVVVAPKDIPDNA